MSDSIYWIINTVLWLGFCLFMIGLECNFKIEGENMFIWLAERAILGSYLIVTQVINGVKRSVEVGYDGILWVFSWFTVVIAWINAKIWDEEE